MNREFLQKYMERVPDRVAGHLPFPLAPQGVIRTHNGPELYTLLTER